MESHVPRQVCETQANRDEDPSEREAENYQAEAKSVHVVLDKWPSDGRGLDIGSGRFALLGGITKGVEPATAMRCLAETKGRRTDAVINLPGVALR